MPLSKYIEAGKIVSTHGVRGELRLHASCDSASFLLGIETFYDGETPLRPASSRVHKNFLLIKLPGVDNIEQALPYIGKTLRFDRDDVELPENTYFINDLIGLSVSDNRTGKSLGKIKEVLPLPANDVYVVTGEGGEIMIPAAPGFIDEVDLAAGTMRVNTIEGMLEGED